MCDKPSIPPVWQTRSCCELLGLHFNKRLRYLKHKWGEFEYQLKLSMWPPLWLESPTSACPDTGIGRTLVYEKYHIVICLAGKADWDASAGVVRSIRTFREFTSVPEPFVLQLWNMEYFYTCGIISCLLKNYL